MGHCHQAEHGLVLALSLAMGPNLELRSLFELLRHYSGLILPRNSGILLLRPGLPRSHPPTSPEAI